jgi:hypothetical protein
MRIPFISLIAAGALTLGGCAYGDFGGVAFGLGYGGGYGGYGGYYDSPYYGSPYYGYGNSWYGSPYFGWYDDYYYPGTGIYVYDRSRTRHVWNDRQRSYWTSRQQTYVTKSGDRNFRDNWTGFRRDSGTTSTSGQHWRTRTHG